MDIDISKDELFKSLNRSGYLLESKIVNSLNEAGFFVEPNQVIKDKNTGKDREIDILAENGFLRAKQLNVFVYSNFILEVKNNLYPFVLLTERKWTPGLLEDAYVQYEVTPREKCPFKNDFDFVELSGDNNIIKYSQYCTFTKKSSKKELMATHPDEIHSSILKMIDWCHDNMSKWSSVHDEIWRVAFYKPILVLKDNLFVLKMNEKPELDKVNHAKLAFNCHVGLKQKSFGIDVVTENYLLKFMQDTIKNDFEIEDKLYEFYKECNK